MRPFYLAGLAAVVLGGPVISGASALGAGRAGGARPGAWHLSRRRARLPGTAFPPGIARNPWFPWALCLHVSCGPRRRSLLSVQQSWCSGRVGTFSLSSDTVLCRGMYLVAFFFVVNLFLSPVLSCWWVVPKHWRSALNLQAAGLGAGNSVVG